MIEAKRGLKEKDQHHNGWGKREISEGGHRLERGLRVGGPEGDSSIGGTLREPEGQISWKDAVIFRGEKRGYFGPSENKEERLSREKKTLARVRPRTCAS